MFFIVGKYKDEQPEVLEAVSTFAEATAVRREYAQAMDHGWEVDIMQTPRPDHGRLKYREVLEGVDYV